MKNDAMGKITDIPEMAFYLSETSQAVCNDDAIWGSPLPVNRKMKTGQGAVVTYGDYFYAVRAFIQKMGIGMIIRAVSRDRNADTGIKEIRIFLEKHGAFYHPARIEAVMQGVPVSFVLNVAVSLAGKDGLEKEFSLLKRLADKYPDSFIPKAYGMGEIITPSRHRLTMFLGEWFKGFYEFHLSYHSAKRRNAIRVWAKRRDNVWLTKPQTVALYRQVAKILTYYYDVETFEQILAWHHAAGDFILNFNQGSITLRLVTVRQYKPMIDDSGRDLKSIFEALLVFLLHLSIRIRLDRLDGVGDIVWADNLTIEGTLKGFFDGLSMKPALSLLPAPLDECFRHYLSARKKTELFEYAEAVVDAYHPNSPDVLVIRKHLKEHVSLLFETIQKRGM